MGMLAKSMQIVLIKVSNVFVFHILEKTKIIRQHEARGRFRKSWRKQILLHHQLLQVITITQEG